MLEVLIFIFVFIAGALLAIQIVPLILKRIQRVQEKKVIETEKKLDKMFIQVKKEKIFLFYTLSPLLLGLLALLLFHNLIFTLVGIVLGLFLPKIVIKNLEIQRRVRFQSQLVDALMVLSSSLRGGLSLLQAIELLVTEMPPPLSQEFGWVLRENKMGITLEESFKRFNKRMHMEELNLLTSSILVARETGGDLTKVLSRLSTTIRDNTKLKDTVRTLTLQGRLQGIIMSILPFLFTFWIVVFNRDHFDIMFQSELGRVLLLLAVILQTIGIILINKFSRINI